MEVDNQLNKLKVRERTVTPSILQESDPSSDEEDNTVQFVERRRVVDRTQRAKFFQKRELYRGNNRGWKQANPQRGGRGHSRGWSRGGSHRGNSNRGFAGSFRGGNRGMYPQNGQSRGNFRGNYANQGYSFQPPQLVPRVPLVPFHPSTPVMSQVYYYNVQN